MYAKLALRNVRRSVRDYAIYFITLLFGVTVFYAFNSIESQTVLLDLNSSTMTRMVTSTIYLLRIFSVVIAVVLAFLVAYANRFIVKRRKREFGTYLLMGMSTRKVARVLLYETLIVGVASLVCGLVLGAGLSQGLAFATAALMGTVIGDYHFVLSLEGAVTTVACFTAMFAFALVLNVIYVSRRRLADLLTAKAQAPKTLRAPFAVRVVAFVASLVVLGVAYWCLKVDGFYLTNWFIAATALMVVGTLLFYWSASTVIITLVSNAKGFYSKGLRAFTLRQVSANVVVNSGSIAVVSILLFFALTTVSLGFGVMQVFVGRIEATCQYDMTVQSMYGYYNSVTGETDVATFEEEEPVAAALFAQYGGDMAACFDDKCSTWDSFVKASAQIDYYSIDGYCSEGATFAWVLEKTGFGSAGGSSDGGGSSSGGSGSSSSGAGSYESASKSRVMVMSLSQLNAVRALVGEDPLTLTENEYLVNNTAASSQAVADAVRAQGMELDLGFTKLTASNVDLSQEVRTTAVSDVAVELVVPDYVVQRMKADGAKPFGSYLDIMYSCDREEGDAAFQRAMCEAFPIDAQTAYSMGYTDAQGNLTELGESQYADAYVQNYWPVMTALSGQEMIEQSMGMKLMITYLGLYIGFVLLISTAAVLAIQQLSETADSLSRYRRLSSIGCDARMLTRSLRAQTCMYFLAPVFLALCHSVYAMWVIGSVLHEGFGINPTQGILVALGVTALVYGCYLVVTYNLSKSMLRE